MGRSSVGYHAKIPPVDTYLARHPEPHEASRSTVG